jgi:DNA polymerase III delta prime subunit
LANYAINYRPRSFDEVVGQSFAKDLLRGVLRKVDESPRSLIFKGPWGCGKSSMCRIFARELNGLPVDYPILDSPYYSEYDSGVTGNVAGIREIVQSGLSSLVGGYRVIVFDESHEISSEGQGVLLKPLEEENRRTFFIFATTDADNLLKTIHSRSLGVEFGLVGRADMVKYLRRICDNEGLSFGDDLLCLISDRSGGHVRDAVQLLNKAVLVGEAEFGKFVDSLVVLIEDVFNSVSDMGVVREKLLLLMRSPLVHIRSDLERVFLRAVQQHSERGGIFGSLKFACLMQLFSYYVSNKSAAFNSSSDAFSFLFMLASMHRGFVLGGN